MKPSWGNKGGVIRRERLKEEGVHISDFRRGVYWKEVCKGGRAIIGGFTVEEILIKSKIVMN